MNLLGTKLVLLKFTMLHLQLIVLLVEFLGTIVVQIQYYIFRVRNKKLCHYICNSYSRLLDMSKKILLIFITFISFQHLLASSKLEPLINKVRSGNLKMNSHESFQKFVVACMYEHRMQTKLSEKEQSICSTILSGEAQAISGYSNYLTSCALDKMAKHAKDKNNKNYYDQLFVNFLNDKGVLYLVDSKNPDDLKKLNMYADELTENLKEEQLPGLRKECMQLTSYTDYNNKILKSKLMQQSLQSIQG